MGAVTVVFLQVRKPRLREVQGLPQDTGPPCSLGHQAVGGLPRKSLRAATVRTGSPSCGGPSDVQAGC